MPNEVPPEPAAPDLNKLVEAALAKHGDQTSTLKAFAADLYAARDDAARLRAKLPADGALVLTGDDAKDYGAYRGLGKPADVRKVADEHAALAAENAALKRDATLRDVAEKAKVNFAVLKRIVPAEAEFVEIKAKGKDGKESTGVGVKLPDAAAVPFDEFPAFADFMASLRPTAPEADRPNWTPSRTDQTRHNQPLPGHEEAAVKARLLSNGLASY